MNTSLLLHVSESPSHSALITAKDVRKDAKLRKTTLNPLQTS